MNVLKKNGEPTRLLSVVHNNVVYFTAARVLTLEIRRSRFSAVETVVITVIINWPSFFFKVDCIVLASMRFTDTVSAYVPVIG